MVFTPSNSLAAAYAQIKAAAAALPNTNTCFVIASPDPDALCATKMISNLLKSDCIIHQIIPVNGYFQLDRTNRLKIENNESLRSIIMLNCGGVIDIAATLSIPEHATVYIIDSHRPLHLGSIYKYEQVNVLDDGEIEEMKDVEEAFLAIEMEDEQSEKEDEDAGEDGDSGSESGAEEAGLDEEDPFLDGIGVNDNEAGGEEDVLDANGEPRRKRKKPNNGDNLDPRDPADALLLKRRKRVEQRRKRNKYLDILTEYYEEGSYYGMSASQMVYMLLNQVGKVTGDALWLAIVALTDQYINDRISTRMYKASALSFKEDTTKFDLTGGAGGGAAADPLPENDDNDDGFLRLAPLAGGNLGGGGPARARFSAPGVGHFGSKGADDRSIECVEEFRLMLMRHWSFHDCMFYSHYVAARLGTWKDRGRQKLTNLLARMGLPQTQSHQPFTEMKITIRKEVKAKLLHLGPSFNMTELLFPSFVRHNGYKATVSASDTLHAVLALLDCGASWMRRHASAGAPDESVSEAKVGDGAASAGSGGAASLAARIGAAASARLTGTGIGTRLGAGAIPVKISEFDDMVGHGVEGFEAPVEGEDDAERAAREARNRRRERETEWLKNFYMAYDALDSINLIYHGIQLSMQFQRAIVKTGISIIEKQQTKTTKTFRFATIGASSGSGNHISGQRTSGLVGENDVSIFGKSTALLHRLGVFLMEAYREHKKKQLPLILAAYNDETDCHLVIGIPILKRGEMKNKFGMAFLKAAQRTNVAFRSDAFDTSVAEIQRDDLIPFIESLVTLV
ncbi:CDC45 family [Chytriomyces sp. MP71]|nr:CDC45 family [Chytriomyces sp. MP71]